MPLTYMLLEMKDYAPITADRVPETGRQGFFSACRRQQPPPCTMMSRNSLQCSMLC